ncbi:MAG: serine/threonine-protein kinase [Gemmataceae bacterium]
MSAESRLLDLLARWEHLREAGSNPTPEELCSDCPELLDALKAHLARLAAFDRHFDSTQTKNKPGETATEAALAEARRYRLLHLHARGGLGEVFVAEDTELHREVAFKQMQHHVSGDADLRRRFLREAEITGRLEHPGIVPVYGLGIDGMGRPFYAMRFIRGETLQEAIRRYHDQREEPLALRQLLGRFVAVCNAVGYAHSRGIIHRDIKPANIMLGAYGETLVVDWGLARPVDRREEDRTLGEETLRPSSDSAAGATRGVLGTPAFMAPEQAAGRQTLVGVASDVYSLGATLYAVLTGKAPLDPGPLDEMLERVQRGEIVPLTTRKAGVPKPLEAICRKAMALRREERYATASELADEVERWLADEPVTAHRDSLLARAGRWGRRHRTAVAAAVALLLTGVVSLALGLAAVRQQELRALAEKKRADENFRLAHASIRDTTDAILKDERLKSLRRGLLERALPYYDQFIEQSDDPKLGQERAATYLARGAVYQDLGKAQLALDDFRQAQQLFEELQREQPKEFDFALQVGICLNQTGVCQRDLGALDEAERTLKSAVGHFAQLAQEHPDRAKAREGQYATLHNLGDVYARTNRPKLAEELHRQELAILEEVTRQRPNEASKQAALADALEGYAQSVARTQPLEKVEPLTREAMALRRQLIARYPNDPYHRSRLADSHNELGLLQMEKGILAQAEKEFRAALELNAPLKKAAPEEFRYRQREALYRFNLAKVYRQQSRFTDAERELQEARLLQVRLRVEHPEMANVPQELAGTLSQLALVFEAKNELEAAVTAYREAEKTLVALQGPGSGSSRVQNELAVCRLHLGGLLREMGRGGEALPLQQQALAAFQEIFDREPADATSTLNVAVGNNNLAITLKSLGRRDEALRNLREATRLHEQLAREHPRIVQHRLNAASSRQNLCNDLGELGRFAEAELEALAGLAILDRAIDDLGDLEMLRLGRARLMVSLGRMEWKHGRGPRSLHWLALAERELQPILHRTSYPHPAHALHGDLLINRAEAYHIAGQEVEALALWETLSQREGFNPTFCRLRAALCRAVLDPARAVSDLNELAAEKKLPPDLRYDVACGFAVAAGKLPAGAEREKAATQALTQLRHIWKQGYFVPAPVRAHLKADADFAPLRERADFKQLMTDIDAQPQPK